MISMKSTFFVDRVDESNNILHISMIAKLARKLGQYLVKLAQKSGQYSVKERRISQME